MVLQELRHSCDTFPGKLVAYVVMPDHLHFIVGIDDGRLSVFVAQFKSAVTIAVPVKIGPVELDYVKTLI
jgi:REP element-mobilizing transposase RayT